MAVSLGYLNWKVTYVGCPLANLGDGTRWAGEYHHQTYGQFHRVLSVPRLLGILNDPLTNWPVVCKFLVSKFPSADRKSSMWRAREANPSGMKNVNPGSMNPEGFLGKPIWTNLIRWFPLITVSFKLTYLAFGPWWFHEVSNVSALTELPLWL